jgi:hypothetical protein
MGHLLQIYILSMQFFNHVSNHPIKYLKVIIKYLFTITNNMYFFITNITFMKFIFINFKILLTFIYTKTLVI